MKFWNVLFCLEVETKTISVNGKEIVITVVKMGEDQCLTVAEAAKLLGCDVSNIKHRTKEHGLTVVTPNHDQMKAAKASGVIPISVTRLNLLPKDTIKALVKIVNTEEAWAVFRRTYRQDFRRFSPNKTLFPVG